MSMQIICALLFSSTLITTVWLLISMYSITGLQLEIQGLEIDLEASKYELYNSRMEISHLKMRNR
jgi:hypothetical protein